MERAQEFLTQLNYDLDNYQNRLGLSTQRRYRARNLKTNGISDEPMYQLHVEQVLGQIIRCKAKIEAVKVYIVAVSALRGAYWSDSQWHTLKSAEDTLAGLGIKDNCVRYANIWD